MQQPDWSIEDEAITQGYVRVAGLDEAGRGPWAGPVVAAAIVVPLQVRNRLPAGINDSKKMKPQARAELYSQLKDCDQWDAGIGQASVAEIDKLNILQATFLAMQRAVESLQEPPDYLLIDGKLMPAFAENGHAVVQGDSKSLSIAAASILAKEHRDLMMIQQAESEYPGYGFAKHKGYGTRQHQQALAELGVCPLHRKSFAPIRKLLER
ncbi:MAG: ribonuclease HII [Verrucomicrobiota bacterium]